jgi:hypothetical protein
MPNGYVMMLPELENLRSFKWARKNGWIVSFVEAQPEMESRNPKLVADARVPVKRGHVLQCSHKKSFRMLKWARELGCLWDENATLPRIFLKLPKMETWCPNLGISPFPSFGIPRNCWGWRNSTHKSPNVGSLQDNPRNKNKNSDNPHPFNSFKNKFYKTNSAW